MLLLSPYFTAHATVSLLQDDLCFQWVSVELFTTVSARVSGFSRNALEDSSEFSMYLWEASHTEPSSTATPLKSCFSGPVEKALVLRVSILPAVKSTVLEEDTPTKVEAIPK